MSLEKAIKYGKERRKPFTHGKAARYSCRNQGSCQWCLENRMINTIRKLSAAKDKDQE